MSDDERRLIDPLILDLQPATLVVHSKPGERVVARVTYCVPALGGRLSLDRLAAGWRIGLDCSRQCDFQVARNLHYAGVEFVDHECASLDEKLVVDPDPSVPLPKTLKTVRA